MGQFCSCSELQDGNDDGLHRGNDSSEHSNQTCSTDTESGNFLIYYGIIHSFML